MSSIWTVVEWAEIGAISACETQKQLSKNLTFPGKRRRPA